MSRLLISADISLNDENI